MSATSNTTQVSADELSTAAELVAYYMGRGLYRQQAIRAARRTMRARNLRTNTQHARSITRRTEAADLAISTTGTFHNL